MATTKPKGASLLPEDAQGGFQVPDGDYTIKEIQTELFTYGGTVPDGVPAIIILYTDSDDNDYEQPYKAGDNQHLAPSEDKTQFVNPNDENAPAAIYKGGAAFMWLSSIFKAGFPKDKVGADVTVFKGTRVSLVSVAAPKGKTQNDKKEGKTIPIVAKVLAMPGASKGRPTQPATRATAAAKPTAPTAGATSNGDLDADTIIRVQEALTSAKNNTLGLVKLKLAVWQTASKAKDGNATAYRTLITPDWLNANSEAGSWMVDGDTVTLAQ